MICKKLSSSCFHSSADISVGSRKLLLQRNSTNNACLLRCKTWLMTSLHAFWTKPTQFQKRLRMDRRARFSTSPENYEPVTFKPVVLNLFWPVGSLVRWTIRCSDTSWTNSRRFIAQGCHLQKRFVKDLINSQWTTRFPRKTIDGPPGPRSESLVWTDWGKTKEHFVRR